MKLYAELSTLSGIGRLLFFTVNLQERKNTLLVERIDLLRESGAAM